MVSSKIDTYNVVSQVATVASDKIYNLQPALSVHSGFSQYLKDAELLRQSADPFAAIVENASDEFVSTVATTPASLFQALPHLSKLGSTSTVIHVDASPQNSDFGLISSLRHSGFLFLQSFSIDEAQKLSIAAYAIAKKLNKPIVHFFSFIQEGSVGPTNLVELESEEEQDAVAEALQKVDVKPFEYIGSNSASSAVVLFGKADPFIQAVTQGYTDLGLVLTRVYRPWSTDNLLSVLPKSVKKLALAEQLIQQTTNWTPLTQDLIVNRSGELPQLIAFQLGTITYENVRAALSAISANLQTESPLQKLYIGEKTSQQQDDQVIQAQESARKLEEAYTKVLAQLFGDRLNTINAIDKPDAGLATNPEYGFGAYLAQQDNRTLLIQKVQQALKGNDFGANQRGEIQDLLSQWVLAARDASSIKDQTVFKNTCDQLVNLLNEQQSTSVTAQEILKYKGSLKLQSNWLVGSDAWSHDLGNSGVHHVISSGENVNMLIIDSEPYSKVTPGGVNRKKDVGLYAMNFGNVYVASVAVYSSYTQLLQAFIEAEQFEGPSVVVAYLPYYEESDDAMTVLQETKRAVETGYWPLYRFNPKLQDKDTFKLDSYHIRKNLEAFLDRENKLTMLSNRSPSFARNLKSSYGSELREAQKSNAKKAYMKLLEGLSGPPLTILFASDGGTAESIAKRLQRRAKGRGLKAVVMAFDDFPFEELAQEENVVFITSTAGQGEFPQNGRVLWDALKNTTEDMVNVHYTVFSLGDSLYWPRKEDTIYYNKPGKDLNSRLKALGAQELVPLGLGDEQADDGYATAYNDWEPLLWTAMGVDGVAGIDEPPPVTNEDIKINSNYLRGTIVEGLQDTSTGAISAHDQQVTKFHGIYMQDDRDVRDERKAKGLEPAYAFMVRVRLPGCVANPDQWLRIDELSDERGNGTFKITTRGTFQLHGVIKEDLKPAIRGMNAALIDTVAACGDVDRNVVAAALPENKKIHDQIVKAAHSISEHLLPETTAYHEIWLEGGDEGDKEGYTEAFANRKEGPRKKKQLVSGSTLVDHEPLYGPTYLPRKFKVSIAVPPHNDVDVYAHDIGLIAVVEDNELVGFNVLVGGGMGTTHNNKKTYPRTGSLLGFVPRDKIEDVCEKIMLVQRDNGDRQNRKHARLKYTVDDMGVDTYRTATEELLGYQFESAREFHFDTNTDQFGWTTDETGLHHFTTFVENGRVEDTPELQFKTGLREIAHVLKQHSQAGEFRLTANQHILISSIEDSVLPQVKELLAQYKLDNVAFSGLRLSSAACVAFPTCGLAMAESERYLPELITKLEGALEEYGLRHDSIVMRMTGCPNGCARPWLAEVALVGKAYGAYNLMLGGGFHGQRLNKLYRNSIKEDEILAILKPLFKRWALERNQGEHFGDFLVRSGVIAETTEGKNFWENVSEDA